MPKLIEKQKNFMNTVITIKVVQDKQNTVDILDSIEKGFDEFDRIVKQYTRFDENSELSNLNRNSGNWTKITPEFFELIEYMLNLANETEGCFDPTIIDFLETYGYDKNYDFSKLDNPKLDEMVNNMAKTRASFKDIELDKKKLKVKLVKAQRIDLGGVGKGYAIDCAYDQLIKVNENFLIDAGGDIRAKGKNEKDEIWKVALRNRNGEVIEDIGYIELNDESVASSGSWARKVKQFHHLINPKTGLPENKFTTVYVIAKKAIDSDAWGTALFVGGEKYLKKHKDLRYFTV
ncbi:MAG: FAD:protein FMN transferase [Candidatus Dojkabacteria bacterium]